MQVTGSFSNQMFVLWNRNMWKCSLGNEYDRLEDESPEQWDQLIQKIRTIFSELVLETGVMMSSYRTVYHLLPAQVFRTSSKAGESHDDGKPYSHRSSPALGCNQRHRPLAQIKVLGGFHISLFAQHRVHQVAIAIDSTIQIAPCSFHADVGFIDVPGSTRLPTPFHTQLICQQWCKARFPLPNRLMGEDKATLHEHLGEIAQAQLVAQPIHNDRQDDIGGVFQKIERRCATLVKSPLAWLSQRNVRYPSDVFFFCSLVAVEAQWGQLITDSLLSWLFPSAYPTSNLHAKSFSEF